MPENIPTADDEVRQLMDRLTRRSFAFGGAAGLGGLLGLTWISTREKEGGIPWPLRRVLQFNEGVSRKVLGTGKLAPEFLVEKAEQIRVNGGVGMTQNFDPARWSLRVESEGKQPRPLKLRVDEVKRLPHVEMVTELKCIEGWSTVVHWGGARFSDFIEHFKVGTRTGEAPSVKDRPGDLLDYVSLETPDGSYYVGLDRESAFHPQTLLCYEMNGKALPAEHGGPLRLVIPLKYGIKNLKRIGTIRFTDRRPDDYWAERGYDWYAGH